MMVQLSVEQETRLSQMAAQAGRGVDELAREAVDCYLSEDAAFHAAVQTGRDAAARGDFMPSSEVWANIERELQA